MKVRNLRCSIGVALVGGVVFLGASGPSLATEIDRDERRELRQN